MTTNTPERRWHNRLPEENLRCNLGWVRDLSARGMRVQSTHRLRGEQRVEICDGTDHVAMRADVKWIKRRGFRKYDVGLELLELRPAQVRMLGRIAVNNRRRRYSADPVFETSGDEFSTACRLLVEGLGYPSAGLALL